MEIFLDGDCIAFKKYSPLSFFVDHAHEMRNALSVNHISAAIFDSDKLLSGPSSFKISIPPDEWSNISQPATAWKSMFITPIFSDGDKLDSFVTKICTMMNLFTKWLNQSQGIFQIWLKDKRRASALLFYTLKIRRRADARGAPSFLICKFYTIFVLKSCAIRHLAIILKLWYYQYRKKEGY